MVLKKATFSLAVGWTLLIAVLCLVKFTDLPSIGVSEADKYVHFTFHFVFTMLWGYYFWLKLNEIALTKIVYVAISSLCYGILIEFLQEKFTTTRHADVFDVLANFSGAVVALVLFVLIKRQKLANK
ncbi:hypothetical protein GS03_00301 [Flavobacterium sangjuense]|uniref:VanZ-like domain-containing protein n=1 Tax=Flavobacterium sangjuense TaxID=2518177 RepID=A0A4P7PQ65_9FLAO|nr:hypothetical protein GS03_00301 [Flavobacterium sangjuense]